MKLNASVTCNMLTWLDLVFTKMVVVKLVYKSFRVNKCQHPNFVKCVCETVPALETEV